MDEAGKALEKVVKQTVMTSVYGVTFTGARQQIQNRLEEVKELEGATEEELFAMAKYLAILTLQSLGTVFSGATDAVTEASMLSEVEDTAPQHDRGAA